MTCLMRGTVGEIVRTADGRALMRQAMDECAAVARLSGHALPEPVADAMAARLLDETSTWAASMMRDIAQGAPPAWRRWTSSATWRSAPRGWDMTRRWRASPMPTCRFGEGRRTAA
ncbi:ketopantoate reductase family protein [Cupriavidus basilensis]